MTRPRSATASEPRDRVGPEPLEALRARYLAPGATITPRALAQLRGDPRPGAQKIYALLKRRVERERAERERLGAMLHFERLLWRSGLTEVAGVDEVGVGPLAGPVVAAAVVFAPDTEIPGVDDSKRLDPDRRETLAATIRARAMGVGIGVGSIEEIDRLNIYHAALLAMRRAVEALPRMPQHVLVDARTIPGLDVPQNPYAKGDGINFSIAAASIVAKDHRDRLMSELDGVHPGYGFAGHKGYDTPEHRSCLARLGPCAVHRMSFAAIREICGQCSAVFYRLRDALDGARDPASLDAVESDLKAREADLDPLELRKLRVLLARRWKALA